MIKVIEDVFNADKPDKNEVLRSLMSALFWQVKSCNNADVKIKHSQYEKELEDIRRQFYDVPSADWNIPEIAKKICLGKYDLNGNLTERSTIEGNVVTYTYNCH